MNRFFGACDDCIIVAQLNDIVVGYIAIIVKRERLQYAYIEDFSVKKEYRNLGIGTRLIRQAEEYAKKKSLSDTVLHVEMSNTLAQKFYKRNGYEILKEEESRILMKKILA